MTENSLVLPLSKAQAEVESPRQQMAHGVSVYNVKCNDGLVLILKALDKSAACVTEPTTKILIERGWGMMVTKKVEGMANMTGTKPQNMTQPLPKPVQTQNMTSTKPQNMTQPLPKPVQTPNKTTPAQTHGIQILTTVYGNNISNQISQLAPYLRPSDIVDLIPSQISYAPQLKSLGVQVAVGGQTNLNSQDIKNNILTMPLNNVDIIAYDYEPGTVPDFSTDQSVAIGHFSELYQDTHALKKLLWINPVWYGGHDWDWGEVAKHTDILCIQVQNFETGAKQFGKNTYGMTLQQVVSNVTQQVKSKSPSTKLYFQFGAATGQTPKQTVDDINSIKSIPFDGVFLFSTPRDPQYVPQVLQGLGR
ncbi:MAG: hypothetical protein KGI25_05430 [Thaumarchaeota archaeon]|nr:hypothetical protein [Nitrososphaerota archaeon]